MPDKQTIVEADLQIDGFTSQGAGVGRMQGLVVFVPGALPGETVRAQLLRGKKNFVQSRLKAILKPSPQRVMADCPLFGRCGGCQLQHASYQEQLRLKHDLVVGAVRRIGGVDTPVQPVLPASQPLGYRNRIAYHALHIDNRIELGFFMQNSRVFIPATVCLLPVSPIRDLAKRLPGLIGSRLPALRDVVIRSNSSGELLMTLVCGEAGDYRQLAEELMAQETRLKAVWINSGKPCYSIYGDKWQLAAGEEHFKDIIAGVNMKLAPASFTQINHEQTGRLYALVKDAIAPQKDMTVLDLYCGAGAISLYLAKSVKQVVGVESYAPAAADAEKNAVMNGVENCRFLAGAAEEILPKLAAEGLTADAVVLDPPRAGCDRAVLEALVKISPEKIVYVSCDPATLSRDLHWLTDNGYKADTIQPVDMFPQTVHVETVVLMCRE